MLRSLRELQVAEAGIGAASVLVTSVSQYFFDKILPGEERAFNHPLELAGPIVVGGISFIVGDYMGRVLAEVTS